MHQYSVDDLVAHWNQAIMGKNGSEISIPTIPLRGLASKISERDAAFTKRGGLILEFNHVASNHLGDEFTRTQIDDPRRNGRPSLPYLLHSYAEKLDLPTETPEYKALMLVAYRAEMDEHRSYRPDYHNTQHYADVVSIMANFILTCRERGTVFYSKKEETLGLLAAVAHDIDHPGMANPAHSPVKNELASFNAIRGLLKHCGLALEDLHTVQAMILATSPNGSHHYLKDMVAESKNELEQQHNHYAVPLFIKKSLDGLRGNPNMMHMAAMLCDADIFGSAGAGQKVQTYMSQLLTSEVRKTGVSDVDFTTPKARMAFFDHMLGEDGFTSDIGRYLGNDNYHLMRKQTIAQLKA